MTHVVVKGMLVSKRKHMCLRVRTSSLERNIARHRSNIGKELPEQRGVRTSRRDKEGSKKETTRSRSNTITRRVGCHSSALLRRSYNGAATGVIHGVDVAPLTHFSKLRCELIHLEDAHEMIPRA